MCPITVENDNQGLLVPSQIALLKVKKNAPILPEYLRLCLAQKETQERVLKIEEGTASVQLISNCEGSKNYFVFGRYRVYIFSFFHQQILLMQMLQQLQTI